MNLLTLKEAAERLRIHPDTLRGLRSTGQIVGVNVSTNPLGQARWRFTVEEVERFLRSRTKSAAPISRRRSRVKRLYT